ncbi:MAG TPA: AI-2E family transporter [Polyangia bacterium]
MASVNKPEVSNETARRFFLFILIATSVALALVVRPVGTALFMAAVLAGALWPLQKRLSNAFRGRKALAAGTLTAAVIVLIVAPIVTMSAFVVKEASDGVRFVSKTIRSEGFSGLVEKLPAPVQKLAQRLQQEFPEEEGGLERAVQKQVTAQGGKAAAAVGAAVATTGSLLFQAAMMMIALFFFLLQGNEVVSWLDETLPLKPGQTHELLLEFKNVSYSVLVSSLATAAVQAVAALIGYYIAKVPNPIFFAAITFVIAFIPAIGAAAVCLAASLLLLVTGHPYAALFLAIWGVVIVGLVDNVVKPLLIKGGMHMNGAVVFFALIGGLGAFGTVGLLIGPLVVSLFLALVRMYRRDFDGARGAPAKPIIASART